MLWGSYSDYHLRRSVPDQPVWPSEDRPTIHLPLVWCALGIHQEADRVEFLPLISTGLQQVHYLPTVTTDSEDDYRSRPSAQFNVSSFNNVDRRRSSGGGIPTLGR